MLKEKIAIVTGAGRGIGREIALTLAKNGATVIVNYNGSKASADEVVEEITKNGGRAEAIQCNVADFAESEALVKTVLDKYKRVDILVNNAGITKDNLIMRMSEEDYDAVLDTNLKGTFNMMRHLSRSFIKQRSGKIINITSVSGVLGNAGQANYSASKAGVIGLTKSVARELASRGINVNAVAPGFIDTDMTKNMTDDAKKVVSEMIPMGKMGSAKDIADMVMFLASENSDYITGQVICVDGGMAI
ncbi:MAG: 3-oxoacyl-[acyl-carrier-protein] reductase [Lachnospiraceae bacterium]|nr:3-oxoacyl-[acyl-carrier-protein] reductase [Lachnospiraceae bacterium]